MSAKAFMRRVATVSMGGGLAQGLTFLTMPVITRLYPPDAYAGWAMLVSVSVLFSAVATLRYELAVVLPQRDEDASNLACLCLLAAVVVSGTAAGVLFLFGREIVGESFFVSLGGWLWAIPPLIAVTALYQVACAWCVRAREFFAYSLAQLLLPLCTVGLQIGLGWSGQDRAGGLIAGTVAGQALAALIMAAIVAAKYGQHIISSLSLERLAVNARQYKNYPLYMTPYTIVGTMRDRLVYLLLGNLGDKAAVGYYGLSSRVVAMPNSFVSNAVRPVFFQLAARAGFSSMETHIIRVLRTLIVCITPGWAFFLIRSEDVLALVFGESWRPAGPYAAVLSMAAIPLLLGNWLDRGFDVLGRQRLAFLMEFAFSGMSLLALACGMHCLQDLFWAIILQAAVLTVYYWCWLFALFWAARFRMAALWRMLGLFVLTVLASVGCALALCALFPFLAALGIHLALAAGTAALFIRRQILKFRVVEAKVA